MNDMEKFKDVFKGIEAWSGIQPKGYFADWLGALTDARFRAYLGVNPDQIGGGHVQTKLPTIEDGEAWFEAVNQVEAARAANGRFIMVTLGACYGAQAVGSLLALQKTNPMPYKLVAVEPEPDNLKWVARHFRDNGIDPDEQWLIGAAISDSNRPVFFPVGSPGCGSQNCFSTNAENARESYVRKLLSSGRSEEALKNLLLRNTTGIVKNLVPGESFEAEITLMSAVTLADILSPFDVVDYIEADIQQSEIIVFPPFMDTVNRKVRRVHIGTHGRDVHLEIASLFRNHGWDVIFDFEPNATFATSIGNFKTNDGVISALNPRLQ